jgi:prevent-host-death family protein
MVQVNVQQAKTQLSELLAQTERGEDVVIARAGRPVARLVAV